MKRNRHTEEQIISILKANERGVSFAELARQNGVTEQTLYRTRGLCPAVCMKGWTLTLEPDLNQGEGQCLPPQCSHGAATWRCVVVVPL